MPEKNFFTINFSYNPNNPRDSSKQEQFKHMFKIWYDIVSNKFYDRFENTEELNTACLSNTVLDIYLREKDAVFGKKHFVRTFIEQATKSIPNIEFSKEVPGQKGLSWVFADALTNFEQAPECLYFFMSITVSKNDPKKDHNFD